jgi:thiol-disulfide isomerase/thioredoxin
MIDWKKYLIVFLITVCLFLTASYLSNYFSAKKIDQIKNIQDKVAINILSSETQYSLLQESSCKNVSYSILSGELDELGKKLEWSEKNLNSTEEVSYLKQYYSLLQIKDYLLMKKISKSCGVKSAFILYFYTTAENCTLCEREGIVLTNLREKYPDLRVYSFDYSVSVSAVKALLSIYKIKDTELPALVLDDEVFTGFHGIDELDAKVQESFKFQEPKKALK